MNILTDFPDRITTTKIKPCGSKLIHNNKIMCKRYFTVTSQLWPTLINGDTLLQSALLEAVDGAE